MLVVHGGRARHGGAHGLGLDAFRARGRARHGGAHDLGLEDVTLENVAVSVCVCACVIVFCVIS